MDSRLRGNDTPARSRLFAVTSFILFGAVLRMHTFGFADSSFWSWRRGAWGDVLLCRGYSRDYWFWRPYV